MSASPSGLSNGQSQTPTPKAGGPPQFIRKSKPADPLRPRKKPARRPNVPKGAAIPRPTLLGGPPQGSYATNGTPTGALGSPVQQLPTNGASAPVMNGGWSQTPKEGTYRDTPLFTTKKALRDIRYHIIRFHGKKIVDPADQDEFIRPVTLHRRDPKQPPPGRPGKEEDIAEEPIDSKEREKMEIAKAEKEAKRMAELAQIAPTGNNAAALAQKKKTAHREAKTTQIHKVVENEEQNKAFHLRYEEALPWHLEDAEGKNTWVGTYEAALSDTNVMFCLDKEAQKFTMVPLEKWYKFTAKNKFSTLTIEQAEAQMGAKIKESRWVMKDKERIKADDTGEKPMNRMNRSMFTIKSESATAKNAKRSEIADMDDLDFAEDDLFQDDDEQATFEPDNDEDTKESQIKIKREQLNANIFDQAVEAEVEKEMQKEFEEQEKLKQLGKKTRKALIRKEKNLMYENDSDSESSDDYTSDEEKQREIDKRKDEEAKNKLKPESKIPSGASSKGTNTPAGKPKYSDPLTRSNNHSLKRSKSPNLSESSGNESSRKKHKKEHTSAQPSRASTPIPCSQPAPSALTGQLLPGRKSSVVKLNIAPSKLSEIQSALPNPNPVHGGSMSDAEATGGEMSDGGKKKKQKLRLGGSPSGSRAGSPEARRVGSGSRAGSPFSQVPGSGRTQASGSGPIQISEIIAVAGGTGLPISGLLKAFTGRIGEGEGHTRKSDFIKLVKEGLRFGHGRLLVPK
ncbi:putative transcription initiation factor IIF subunit alpha [Amylocarpus encephaloides]|uniref:Transcription initiation factor IIF subunit alpha n=1 Tax=Amylocarpus encephaloides TaxID=45428 RepID=A0A9P7Y8V0_9HELO|nr:putative transcription initiation factor IIF subunit alpha [Amylocarpus encephaloides]